MSKSLPYDIFMNLILDKINYLGNLCDKQIYSYSRRHDNEIRDKSVYEIFLSIICWMGELFIYNYKILKLLSKYLKKAKKNQFFLVSSTSFSGDSEKSKLIDT